MQRALLLLLILPACQADDGTTPDTEVVVIDCPEEGETEGKPADTNDDDTGQDEETSEPTVETVTVIYTRVNAQILEHDGTVLKDECQTHLHLYEETEGSGLWRDPTILTHGTALLCGGASLELSEFYVTSAFDEGDAIRGNVTTSVIDGEGVFTVGSLSFETTGSMNLAGKMLHVEPVADPLTYTSSTSPENPDYQVVFTATGVDFYEVVVEEEPSTGSGSDTGSDSEG